MRIEQRWKQLMHLNFLAQSLSQRITCQFHHSMWLLTMVWFEKKYKYTCIFTQHFADDFISKYIFMFYLIRSVDLPFNLKIHAISSSKEDLQIPPSGIWKYDFDIRPLANFLEKIWFYLYSFFRIRHTIWRGMYPTQ